jgi:hypothetical protein
MKEKNIDAILNKELLDKIIEQTNEMLKDYMKLPRVIIVPIAILAISVFLGKPVKLEN